LPLRGNLPVKTNPNWSLFGGGRSVLTGHWQPYPTYFTEDR